MAGAYGFGEDPYGYSPIERLVKVSLLGRLLNEWNELMKEYSEETLETYNFTVEKKGNKQTFEEFKEKLKMDWFKERLGK